MGRMAVGACRMRTPRWRVTPFPQKHPVIPNHSPLPLFHFPNFPLPPKNIPIFCQNHPKIPRKWMWQRMHSRHAVRVPSAPVSLLPLQWSSHSTGRHQAPKLGFGSDIPNLSTSYPTLEGCCGLVVRWLGGWLGRWFGLGPGLL